jgi:cation:H+ antiporter
MIMDYFINIGLILISSLILIKAVSMFIRSASKIAHHFKISGYTISFLLVAIATSLPETVVGITSAIEKNPILSYGNALGSNIALLTIIVAIPGLINSGIKTREIYRTHDIYYTALFSLLALSMSLDGQISRMDGVALLVSYIIYIVAVLRRSHGIESLFDTLERINIWKQAVFFTVSLVLLLIASEGIVKGAINLSSSLGLGLAFVGLTVTAIGTSLPEIAYAIRAVKDNKENEILGDVIGSVVANSTLVLGITAVIYPIKLPSLGMSISSIMFLLISLLLFLIFASTKRRLERFETVILFTLYLVFVAVEFFLQGQT